MGQELYLKGTDPRQSALEVSSLVLFVFYLGNVKYINVLKSQTNRLEQRTQYIYRSWEKKILNQTVLNTSDKQQELESRKLSIENNQEVFQKYYH